MSQARQEARKELQEQREQRERVEQMRDRAIRPPVDVFEDEERIIVHADLPGVSQEKLSVTVEGQLLTIEGSADLLTPENMKAAYAEFRTPRYQREFTLSGELDPNRIEATLRNGVLTVSIPKAEHAKPKKISVSTE
jgi:HSP20 family molecular chaperone IbpA